jgi:DNA polymerase-3 subunit delta'
MLNNTLKMALDQNTFPQAVLLTGERGVGKIRMACELAMALMCTNSKVQSEPCGFCFHCKSWNPDSGQNPWLWLLPRKQKSSDESTSESESETESEKIQALAANPWSEAHISAEAFISVGDVRALIRNLGSKETHARVVIVPEVDRMNVQAANAFLKTLEEVPANTYFILTSSRPTSLLPTILSRALRVAIPPYGDAEFKRVLRSIFSKSNSSPLEEESFLFSLSGGSVSRALNWIENKSSESCDGVLSFLSAAGGGVYSYVAFVQEFGVPEKKDEASQFLETLYLVWGDIGRVYSGIELRLPMRDKIVNLAQYWNDADRYAIIAERILETRRQIAANTTPQMAINALGYFLCLAAQKNY